MSARTPLTDLRAAAAAVSSLVASTDPDPRVKASADWTVRETLVHLIAGAHMYADCLQGRTSPLRDMRRATMDAFNAGSFLALAEERSVELARLHTAAVERLMAAAALSDLDRTVPFHAGTSRPAAFLVTAMGTEQVLHGWDIASATRSAMELDVEVVARLSSFFVELAPLLYRADAGLDGLSVWVTPDAGPGWGVAIQDGHAHALEEPGGAGCTVSGPPLDVMLWTSQRRPFDSTNLIAGGRDASAAGRLMSGFRAA